MKSILTNRVRYRVNFFHKLILQVEYTQLPEVVDSLGTMSQHIERLWRDATVEDLTVAGENTGE